MFVRNYADFFLRKSSVDFHVDIASLKCQMGSVPVVSRGPVPVSNLTRGRVFLTKNTVLEHINIYTLYHNRIYAIGLVQLICTLYSHKLSCKIY